MRITLLFLGLSIFVGLYGQQLITDDSIILKRGFYKDFYEFKYNKPSVALPPNYPVIVCEQKYGGAKSNAIHLCYMISIDKEQAKSLKNIYGFCDGKDIYIFNNRSLTNTEIVFEQLVFKGRYCIFQRVINKGYIPAPAPLGIVVMIPTSKGLSNILIDLNTSKFLFLKPSTLKSIIKDDNEVFNKFKSDKNKKEKLTDYLIEYSLKHKNDIDRNKKDVTTGEINELLNKLPSDSTFDTYYNRVIEKLKTFRDITKIELWQSKYGNGNYRFIGLSAIHKFSFNTTYNYKIGYWRYFYKRGQIQKEIMYDLMEEKIFEREYELKNSD